MRQSGESFYEAQVPERTTKQEGLRVGNVIVIAQRNGEVLNRRKRLFLDQSYQVRETPHFVICQRPLSHQIVLMHRFDRTEINADLIRMIGEELPAFGILSSAREFNAMLFAVIASTFPSPRNQTMIWRHFCLNTLARLRVLISQPLEQSPPTVSHIVPFAEIYRRVLELFVGQNMLDVGSSFGFLPLLMAELIHDVDIIGCDNNPEAIRCSAGLATATNAHRVSFSLRDVLSPDILDMGHFDTVTALHLLEHLPEQDMPIAFTHLLQVTSKRLIVAVPFEEKAQALYGHQQVFTLEKLRAWGEWCTDALGSDGHYWCEEVMGGMLIVDRLKRSELHHALS